MMFDEDIYKKIDAYVNDDMSVDERTEFEKEMSNDPELAEEVEVNEQMLLNYGDYAWGFIPKNSRNAEAKALENYFRSEEAIVLSGTIERARIRYKQKHASVRRRNFFYYAAASVVMLFLAGNIFFNQQESPEELADKYISWETLPSMTVRGTNKPPSLSKGQQLFNQEKYTEAIAVFETYREESINTMPTAALMYLGASYMEAGQYENAISTFDELWKRDVLDSDHGLWYKALAFLKQGKKDKAKPELGSILSDPEHPHFEKAQELMGELK